MFPWIRPAPHADFSSDAVLLLAAVRKDVSDGKRACFDNREIWSGSWLRRQQPRGLHKKTLVGPEWKYAKCVWCERLRDWERELDVEHYRPKGKVTRYDGQPPDVLDKPPTEIEEHDTGYWWLAFAWKNYALSCKTCNQMWKRNLFPVIEPRLSLVEGVEAIERPLLLEPGLLFDTSDHFAWDDMGYMQPRSEHGRATIITCGLNRGELVAERLKVIEDVRGCLDKFVLACRGIEGGEAEARESIKRLAEMGARTAEFTSMVRWFAEQRLGHAWEELAGMPA